jgi:chromosome partitioning protein
MIVTVASLKGGVGKTTLAVALAEAAAERDGGALLVDADSQGSAMKHAELAEE